MADIELVIKIPEEKYEWIKENNPKANKNSIIGAIVYGTPLPKGHDRLVETNAVVKALFNHKTIYDVSTIIEADRSEENWNDDN